MSSSSNNNSPVVGSSDPKQLLTVPAARPDNITHRYYARRVPTIKHQDAGHSHVKNLKRAAARERQVRAQEKALSVPNSKYKRPRKLRRQTKVYAKDHLLLTTQMELFNATCISFGFHKGMRQRHLPPDDPFFESIECKCMQQLGSLKMFFQALKKGIIGL